MVDETFRTYLAAVPNLGESKQGSIFSTAKRIERHEGDLDAHFERDGMRDLVSRLTYTPSDRDSRSEPEHSIPINGKKGYQSIYEGTLTLLDAAKKYRDFKNGVVPEGSARVSSPSSNSSAQQTAQRAEWPIWEQPNEADLLALAHATAKHIRFLDPTIVEVIARDNEKHASEWSSALQTLGIEPKDYLWDGSACSFPGIRRHSGAGEIKAFRDGDRTAGADALKIDDNSYPKQIWAFTFLGRKFGNYGPTGYRLAHLIDHKGGDRFAEEIESHDDGSAIIPGLYTSAANSAYISGMLMGPTDSTIAVRNLILRRAVQLYGQVCNLLPEGYGIKAGASGWELSEFEWADPVGNMDNIAAFLEYREREIRSLIEERLARN